MFPRNCWQLLSVPVGCNPFHVIHPATTVSMWFDRLIAPSASADHVGVRRRCRGRHLRRRHAAGTHRCRSTPGKHDVRRRDARRYARQRDTAARARSIADCPVRRCAAPRRHNGTKDTESKDSVNSPIIVYVLAILLYHFLHQENDHYSSRVLFLHWNRRLKMEWTCSHHTEFIVPSMYYKYICFIIFHHFHYICNGNFAAEGVIYNANDWQKN